MKKKLIKILWYLFFLAIGVIIFWFIYRKMTFGEIIEGFKEANYFWISISLIAGVLSQISRAMRWNMLIKPMGYKPRLINTFLSCYILYFVNLLLPRTGEVVRAIALSRSERIPFSKLAGTVFTERLADLIMLVILAIIILSMNFSILERFFLEYPQAKEKLFNILSVRNISLGFITIIILFVFLYMIRHQVKKIRFINKLSKIKEEIFEGVKSILKMKNKGIFIFHTCFIYLMWLVMFYVVFLAYKPTQHLNLQVGMVTFLMGGLAMLAPIQGGIGPWHFMVIYTLTLYDIDKNDGRIFAFLAHTVTNLSYIILGGIAIIMIYFINKNRVKLEKN